MASVSLMPELSKVDICLVKSIMWVFRRLAKKEDNEILLSALELTWVIDEG